ncbi:ABC transporter substrate-binding protein [Pseudahrensia aquimaris]|uniref:ABC transporter substrate-binding protein n=1 Tax=Pseudahrensia aquimaris TaxID=744461 RepID=A0ABW3F9P0_9HYPH
MRKLIKSLVAATALAGTLAATPAFAETCPNKGGTLVSWLGQTPRHLNPAVQSGVVTGAPGAQLFATPLRYTDGWEPEPYLAESVTTSDDGLSVTIKLKDANFHDGKPITSEDVKFSVETIKANHPFKAMFGPVESVETPDPKTAVLKLSQPHPALMLAMSSQLMAIIPKHVYGDGQDIKAHPQNSENVVGSGPFKLVEFTRDQHVILERNDDYFMDPPCLDRIVMRIIKDQSAASIGLENGELHMAPFMNTVRNIKRLEKAEGLNVTSEGYAAIGALDWLAFNTKKGPLADKRVRQAIAYAVDKKFIMGALMQGLAQEAKGPIHPGSPLAEPNLPSYDVDLEKAAALLDEAGFPMKDGKRMDLSINFGWPSIKPQAEYVKAALKKVGIEVAVKASPDFPTWAKTVSNHDFDMTMDTVFNWGDPVIGVHRTYDSKNIKPGVIWSNTQQYENPRVDELMEMAGKETDPVKRKALYKEFQEIVADELPVYWLNTLPYHTVYSDKVGNPVKGIWSSSSPMDRVYLK